MEGEEQGEEESHTMSEEEHGRGDISAPWIDLTKVTETSGMISEHFAGA